MVTLLVQRQQREATQRKERLLAARQAAAQLSVQQARSYKDQKRKQNEDIREDARQMWLQAQAHDLQMIDALVQRNVARQSDGDEAAAQVQADLQRTACAEDAAWQAEHQLEAARHRLAVAYTRTEQYAQRRPQEAAQRRREAVRSNERQRAARVAAAAPSVRPLADVMRSLRAAPVATDNRAASIPVASLAVREMKTDGSAAKDSHTRGGVPPASSDASPRPRWRMSSAALHAKVVVHVSDGQHNSEVQDLAARRTGEVKDLAMDDGSGDEMTDEAAHHTTHTYALECASTQARREQTRTDGLAKAVQRATAALRRQHDERTQAEAARQALRERMAAVKAVYRHPREEAPEEAAATAAATASATAPLSTEAGVSEGLADPSALSSPPPPPPQRPPPQRPPPQRAPPQRAPPHGLTRQQQALKAYRECEDDFRATFIDGPPVAVQISPAAPRTASLQELLRPAQVADLLYAEAPAPAAATPPSVMRREKEEEELPLQQPSPSRVLPSAPLHMQPLHPHQAEHRVRDVSPDVQVSRPEHHLIPPEAKRSQSQQHGPQSVPGSQGGSGGSAVAPQVFAREPHRYAGRASSSPPLASPIQIEQSALPAQHPPPQPSPAVSTPPPPPRPVTAEEEVALSPLTPAPVAATERVAIPVATKMMSPPPHSSTHAKDAPLSSHSSPAVSAATTPLRTPPWHTQPRHSESQQASHSEAAAAVTSSASSPPQTGTTETSRMSDVPAAEGSAGDALSSSVFSSSSSSSGSDSCGSASSRRHPMPTMTAEQLKLALVRLRSRITAAQV